MLDQMKDIPAMIAEVKNAKPKQQPERSEELQQAKKRLGQVGRRLVGGMPGQSAIQQLL